MKKLFRSLSQFTRILLIIISALLLFGQFYYWFGLGLHFLRWWLIGFGLLFAYWGWKSQRLRSSKALIVIVLLLVGEWTFHRVFYQSLDQVKNSPTELSLMSYNVFFKNTYPAQALSLIRQQQADVLLVQELTPAWHQRLVNTFGKQYPYRAVKPLVGTHGLGIYSKYPLKAIRYLNTSANRPISQTVTLIRNNKSIQLTNIHLASPSRAVEQPERFFEHMETNAALRVKQWSKLMNFLRVHKANPQLIIGDANTLPYEPVYQNLRKSFVDLHSTSGTFFGWTFPNTARIPFPFLRLDYAFARGELEATKMEVIEGGSSDHLPIYIEVIW